jgi:SNF2 family DNA or RNA helicase
MIALDCHGIGNCFLHGGMTTEQRTWQLNKFRTSDNVEAFVVSIEAGGVGLNMTCADEVYLMVWHDPSN